MRPFWRWPASWWSVGAAVAASALGAAQAGAAPSRAEDALPGDSQDDALPEGSLREGLGTQDLSSCGRPGQPLCPMQAWMKTEVGAPLGEGKLSPVASALGRLEASPPDPGWALWRSSASEGAAAALKGDMAAVRQSCRTCHDAYRTEYRKRFRTRPPPP